MMNFHTISFLEKYKIPLVAVTMYFQATGRDEPKILNWGGGGWRGGALSDTSKVGVPYRVAKRQYERSNSEAIMSATSSICMTLVTMQTSRNTDAFLLMSWCLVNTEPK